MRRFTIVRWVATVIALIILVLMMNLTATLMPSKQKADSRFFLGAVEACRESDPRLTKLQFYEVVHRFRPADTTTYLDAVEKILAECNSPTLEERLKTLRAERETYLSGLKERQERALMNTLVDWFLVITFIYGWLYILYIGFKWLRGRREKENNA